MDKNYDIINFILKCLYFKKARVANFAESSKLQPCLPKQHLNTQKSSKNWNLCVKM